MGQVLHGSATTTAAIRRAIQHSQESLRVLARRHGINPKTVAKWKNRESIADRRTGPTTVTRDQTAKDDGLLQTIQVDDGLGRVIRLLRPGEAITDIQYDAIGHQASVSNPYYTKSDSTYDLTSYTYDALGRQLSATRASDGSATTVSFAQQNNTMSGLKSVSADASGVTSTTYTDPLGRVSSILDNLGNRTTYSYDGLSNLTGVTQGGNASLGEVSRVRTFKYDSLSRLLWANNPESGVICYGHGDGTVIGCNTDGYDSNGNLLVKTDARGVIVNYSYDALNRLLSKQYASDATGTAASCYQYDVSSVVGAGSGLLGKMTNSWTQALSSGTRCPSAPPSTGVISLHSFLSYDPLGRLTAELEGTAASCGHISYTPRYTYDLAGNTITHSSGVPSGIGNLVFTNSYDTAGRLSTITSSSTALPMTLFTATQAVSAGGCSQSSSPAYSPAGGLQNAILGVGLQLTRSYDPRLRVSCEADIGNSPLNPTPGTVTIQGEEALSEAEVAASRKRAAKKAPGKKAPATKAPAKRGRPKSNPTVEA